MINVEEYEGAYCDRGEGYYSIDRNDIEYIVIPKLELTGKVIECEFQIVKGEFLKEQVEELVYDVMLDKYLGRTYAGKAEFVDFTNLNNGEAWRNIYFG